jgi:hypothetical protein
MECEECKRLGELMSSSLHRYHEQRHIDHLERRGRTQAARLGEKQLLNEAKVAAAKYRLHQAADHPELGLKSTFEDLNLVFGEDGTR